MQDRALKLGWLGCATVLGLATFSFALGAVPKSGKVTNDTAIYQNLSEIRVARETDLNFDSDVSKLAAAEGRYQEKLPSLASHPRLRAPLERISKQKYRRVK